MWYLGQYIMLSLVIGIATAIYECIFYYQRCNETIHENDGIRLAMTQRNYRNGCNENDTEVKIAIAMDKFFNQHKTIYGIVLIATSILNTAVCWPKKLYSSLVST